MTHVRENVWLCAAQPHSEFLLLKTVLMNDQMATRHQAVTHTASLAFQASFNEQIKHIIRKLHAVFVQP